MQLQISTSLNDGSMSPVASPSPNSRNQFIAPPNKGRMMMGPGPQQQMGVRQVVPPQLQRQQSQQRMGQSPFSPQANTPQSPNDLFPGSPSGDGFNRPDDQQFLHSPQTPKPMPQQQSPIHAPGTPNSATMSPVYAQNNQQPVQAPNIRPLENMGQYVQAPGTPRPSFNPGQTRTTVYARPDMFAKPPFIQSPQQPTQDQSNRQLRDLLQRSQAPTNLPGPAPQVPSSFNLDNEVLKNQQNQQLPQAQISDNTFRQPLPPGMRQQQQQRMQSMVGGQMIRQLSNPPQQRMIMTPDNRPRQQGIRPGLVLNPQQQQMLDQQQMSPQPNQMNLNQPRMTLNTNPGVFNTNQGDMMAVQGQQGMMMNNQQQQVLAQQRVMNANLQQQQHGVQQVHQITNQDPNVPTTVNQATAGDSEGIPESVTAELEKLEQDENVGMDNVGDILGGLGDDDDDLLNSLTADMGDTFNILEYADPELDTTDEKSALLDSLEMDENDASKEEKMKNLEAEKAKAHFSNIAVPSNSNLNQVSNMFTQNRMPMAINPNQAQLIAQQQQQATQQQQIQQPMDIQNQMNPNQPQQMQPNPQMMLNAQQQQQNNFQPRSQVRFKHNQILPEINQIHQQMMLQVMILDD
jgi:hypothetical protein